MGSWAPTRGIPQLMVRGIFSDEKQDSHKRVEINHQRVKDGTKPRAIHGATETGPRGQTISRSQPSQQAPMCVGQINWK